MTPSGGHALLGMMQQSQRLALSLMLRTNNINQNYGIECCCFLLNTKQVQSKRTEFFKARNIIIKSLLVSALIFLRHFINFIHLFLTN